MTEMDDRTIQRDRMRFIKNTASSSLAILGILFNVFYFVSIYQSDVGTYYYKILIGVSIVYNLIFMLAVFLSSEGVKNYQKNYSYLLAVIGIGQIVRVFILPMQAHSATTMVGGGPGHGRRAVCLDGGLPPDLCRLPPGLGGHQPRQVQGTGGPHEDPGSQQSVRR